MQVQPATVSQYAETFSGRVLTTHDLILDLISQHHSYCSRVFVSDRHSRFIKSAPLLLLVNPLIHIIIIVICGNPDDSSGSANKKCPQMLVAFLSYSSVPPVAT
jgi:hypothetical protein